MGAYTSFFEVIPLVFTTFGAKAKVVIYGMIFINYSLHPARIDITFVLGGHGHKICIFQNDIHRMNL